MYKFVLPVLMAPLMGCVLLHADDAENCKDSPLITRMPGSEIHSCDHKEFDQLVVHVKKDADGNVTDQTLEGEHFYWDYGTREGVSEIQVFRNFQTALRNAGFTIVYTESPNYLAARKGSTWYVLENSGSYYYQHIVAVKQMQQEVTADASQLKDELAKSGRVAVYGINFETSKAAILPESESVLGEVQKLLEQDESLKLRIEGHTDNTGGAAANQALSQKRAQAVMGWLIAHGIDASRLSAKGFGDTKPLADNSTEEGRAKNRRVELVKN